MSEQQAEPTRGESGSVSAGPAVPTSSDTAAQATPKAAAGVESPDLVPGQDDASTADAAKAENHRRDTPKSDTPKSDTPRLSDTPKSDAPRPDASPAPGKIMIMSSGDRGWDHSGVEPEVESEQAQGMFGKRRLSALAAVVALAAVAGALGGALATAGVMHFAGGDSATSGKLGLEASVARIDADLLALKAGVEHTARAGISQYNKTSDRLDKVEKAQAEPAARLAKLSEAVDRLRAAPPVAAKDVTGSISPPATASVPLPLPKPEVGRLPTVKGWVLRDVANGGALIEGRRGLYEVYVGDPVPGVGRVDAVRRQDGRWVVVTSKGLIVAR